MPGLAAIVMVRPNAALAAQVRPMAMAMCHEGFHKMEVLEDPARTCAAARVSIGAVNMGSQPAFNEDRSVFVFLDGEIGSADGAGAETTVGDDTALLLRLYARKGDRFAEGLNGSFLVVLHDSRENKTIIANDVMGLCPAFYVEKEGTLFLASEIKSLLRCAAVPPSVNEAKLGQYFLYDGVPDDETLVEGVRRLPGGSSWICRAGSRKTARSFDLAAGIPPWPGSRSAFEEEARRLFLKILPRYCEGPRLALSLTGGWDTRAILATVRSLGISLPCFTLGGAYRDSMDVTLASRLAKECGLNWSRLRIGPDFFVRFPELALKAVDLSDGMASVFQADNLYFYPLVREFAGVRLSGAYGSQTMDGSFLFSSPRFDPRVLSARYLDEHGPPQGQARDFSGPQGIVDVLRWLWPQGYRSLQRCYVEERTPYVDRDLLTFLSAAPREFVTGAALQKHIILKTWPSLADLPSDRGGYIRTGARPRDLRLGLTSMPIRFGSKLDRGYLAARLPHRFAALDPIMVGSRLERVFLGRANQLSFRRWVKYELREFFEGVLREERTLSRPYLDPDFVRMMTADHFGHRANYHSEIGKIVSLELWHRRFIDGGPGAQRPSACALASDP